MGRQTETTLCIKPSFDAGEMAVLFECVWQRSSLVLMKYNVSRRLPV